MVPTSRATRSHIVLWALPGHSLPVPTISSHLTICTPVGTILFCTLALSLWLILLPLAPHHSLLVLRALAHKHTHSVYLPAHSLPGSPNPLRPTPVFLPPIYMHSSAPRPHLRCLTTWSMLDTFSWSLMTLRSLGQLLTGEVNITPSVWLILVL